MAKSFFVDMTRCTACRGCQVACKQWHKLPATETKQLGTHQNPQDLSFETYKLVRFSEQEIDGKLHWLFMADQCRHCIEPPCKAVADGYDERAIYVDPMTGGVIYTQYTKNIDPSIEPLDMCPYNIPRKDKDSGIWGKCDMCLDRVHNGMKPACVQVCPTGTMNFGEREEMLDLAQKRLAAVQKQHPKAYLADVDAVRTIFLAAYPPSAYYDYLVAEAATNPRNLTRKQMFAKLFAPARLG